MMEASVRRPTSVVAVVLTHARPRLAELTVRMLIDVEAFTPKDIILVINGEGGLEDPELEASIDCVRLANNIGPAGGFRAGIERALSQQRADWIYVCEDDVALLQLDRPLVRDLVARVEALHAPSPADVAAVVAYGRQLDLGSGRTAPHDPGSADFVETDCAAWGCTLLNQHALRDLDVLPDSEMFFGYEDIDFFLRIGSVGGTVLLDGITARDAAAQVSPKGRTDQFRGERPDDSDEQAWRHYYAARNFFVLRRRYGRARWTVTHIALSVRRWQLARFGLAVGRAILDGLIDGLRGKQGQDPRYLRAVGELEPNALHHDG